MNTRIAPQFFSLMAACALLLLGGCATAPRDTFATPDDAVTAAVKLIGSRDKAAVERIFGPGSTELFSSGDEDADREDFERVGQLIREKLAFEDIDAGTKVVLMGEKAWPWPLPLVQTSDGRWRFDTAAGYEELLNRRIGRNELWTLTALRALVDAQMEYAAEGRDGNPRAFAQRFRSSTGKHDGLYWPATEGEPASPLGDLLADSEPSEGEPHPFHGYFYRILSAQGPDAPGGERNYIDGQGLLTAGFAAIAWPAKYGNSGVMTFLINHRGIVFQKDLGAETDTIAPRIHTFNPDTSWEPTADSAETAHDADGAPDEVVE